MLKTNGKQFDLFRKGCFRRDSLSTLETNLQNIQIQNVEEESEREYRERLRKLYGVANEKFAPLGPGERLGTIELRRWFVKIKHLNWPLKDYNKMRVRELRNYRLEVKQEINTAYRRPSYFDR